MAAKVDARRRAREAKARLDAERVERDKKIEEAATAFYVADDRLDELRDEMQTTEDDRNRHILSLFELGQTADAIAVLTGLSVTEVRKIKRTTSTEQNSPAAPDDGNR